jgi:hypothetical protein
MIKQKQIENLSADLASKANQTQVLHKANNLSDIPNVPAARNALDVHSKAEVNALIAGAENAYSVADLDARDQLTGLKVSDRIFVTNDGDGKWALYLVNGITDGSGATSTYQKIADQDIFDNAMTASAVKTAYESNANTNAFTDAEKSKLSHISVSQAVNLDEMESDVNNNTAAVATAQSTANNALSTANAAQSTANGKEDRFTETRETFTDISAEDNQPIEIQLSHDIKDGFDVLVFFGGVRVTEVSWSAGGDMVEFVVPYHTEPTDLIHVIYKY